MSPIARGLTALSLILLASQPAFAGGYRQSGGDAGSARYDRYLEQEAKKEREKAERMRQSLQSGDAIRWNGQHAQSGFSDVPDSAIQWRVPPQRRAYDPFSDQRLKGQ